jgi:hypothetical protein
VGATGARGREGERERERGEAYMGKKYVQIGSVSGYYWRPLSRQWRIFGFHVKNGFLGQHLIAASERFYT